MSYHRLRPGMRIRCRYGSRGSQPAQVVRITEAGNVYVRKWLANSGRWTKPVRLWPVDYIAPDDLAEQPD